MRAGSASANPSVFTAGRPGTGLIDSRRSSRQSLAHRLIVARDTMNCFTISSRGTPRPTAATTRLRRSSEYPRILLA